MVHALEWVLFGLFVWGCCIVLQAVQRRIAPETGTGHRPRRRGFGRRAKRAWCEEMAGAGSGASERESELEEEIARLRKRIETLEAIVTDRKFQWDQELNSRA